MRSESVTTRMRAIEQYFLAMAVLFFMHSKVALTFQSVFNQMKAAKRY